MPTYEYACDLCGHQMEVFQSIRDERLVTCPECAKDGLKRLIGRGAGIIFKGSGFYQTDYKNAPAPKAESSKDSAPASGESSSSKPATTPAPASTPSTTSAS
jgi:putative FmdB family regulatory protein